MKKLVAIACVPLLAASLAACSSGKDATATKEEVTQGVQKIAGQKLDEKHLSVLGDEVRDKYAQCITDGMYDSLSPEGRAALAKTQNGDISSVKLSQEDKAALDKSIEDCETVIVDAIIPE